MHKKLLDKSNEQIKQEREDLDYMKTRNPKGYEQGEKYLDGQSATINRVSSVIHRLRSR